MNFEYKRLNNEYKKSYSDGISFCVNAFEPQFIFMDCEDASDSTVFAELFPAQE